MAKMTRQQALQIICDDCGYDSVDKMLEHCVVDSINPGMCVKCKAVIDSIEPDARDGYCESCGSNKVASALVIAGLI